MPEPSPLSALALRPFPPSTILEREELDDALIPAPEVEKWIRAVFLDPSSPLFNPDHEHLTDASIGVLWTNAANTRNMKAIAGTAEVPRPPTTGGKWGRVAYEQQLREWFGEIPDFKITLYAPYLAAVNDITFCAITEHELYHCGQALDANGFPAFHRDSGLPKFAILGHCVEEFVGIVRRYGAGAAAGETAALVAAGAQPPEIGVSSVASVCGNCQGAA